VVLERDHNAARNILAKAEAGYPGAQRNILFFGGGKRFWTDCLSSSLPTEDEQAGWLKEEPPVIYAGECQ